MKKLLAQDSDIHIYFIRFNRVLTSLSKNTKSSLYGHFGMNGPFRLFIFQFSREDKQRSMLEKKRFKKIPKKKSLKLKKCRSVHFLPVSQVSTTSNASIRPKRTLVISSNLMQKIQSHLKRQESHRPTVKQPRIITTQYPMAPKNSSSFLMDQYSRRCHQQQRDEPDVDTLSSCIQKIDPFGSFAKKICV